MRTIYLILLALLGSMTLMAQGNDTIDTFMVQVDPNIQHGTLNLRPSGEVPVGARVFIIPVPDNGYHFISATAYHQEEPEETIEIIDNHFVMPGFNVMVTARFEGELPSIDEEITAPDAICAGESLALTAPTVSNATSQGWMLVNPLNPQIGQMDYTGQTLDASFNHWELRYWASNAVGMVYSEFVTITVNALPEVTLTGETSVCSMLETEYRVAQNSHCSFTWSVTDEAASWNANGNKLTVRWITPGEHKVVVEVENTATHCASTAELTVEVQSYVTSLNDIVAKVHDGMEYILIYPNPADTYKYQWYKNGVKIDGATGQYYYQSGGLDNGEYTVYVSNNADAQGNLFCGDFTAPHTVNNSRMGYVVSPNPSSVGKGLTILNNSGHEAQLTIYSLDGKLLHRQQIEPGESPVSVSLAKGIYFCHLNDGSAIPEIQKLVIQ